jgi:hypothetical protein
MILFTFVVTLFIIRALTAPVIAKYLHRVSGACSSRTVEMDVEAAHGRRIGSTTWYPMLASSRAPPNIAEMLAKALPSVSSACGVWFQYDSCAWVPRVTTRQLRHHHILKTPQTNHGLETFLGTAAARPSARNLVREWKHVQSYGPTEATVDAPAPRANLLVWCSNPDHLAAVRTAFDACESPFVTFFCSDFEFLKTHLHSFPRTIVLLEDPSIKCLQMYNEIRHEFPMPFAEYLHILHSTSYGPTSPYRKVSWVMEQTAFFEQGENFVLGDVSHLARQDSDLWSCIDQTLGLQKRSVRMECVVKSLNLGRRSPRRRRIAVRMAKRLVTMMGNPFLYSESIKFRSSPGVQ